MVLHGMMNLVQWPAMTLTVIAAWLVTSQTKGKRRIGFWCFILSNVLWTLWGLHDGAYAIVVLQLALGVINIWGAYKTSEASKNSPLSTSQP